MTLVGCDPHSRKQQVAVLDTTTGEVLERPEWTILDRCNRSKSPPSELVFDSGRGLGDTLKRGRASAAVHFSWRRAGEDGCMLPDADNPTSVDEGQSYAIRIRGFDAASFPHRVRRSAACPKAAECRSAAGPLARRVVLCDAELGRVPIQADTHL